MTQTTLPSTTPPTPRSAGPDDASDHQDGRHLPVTLWLFGLTAMTLVFASLLLLGLLVPVGRDDSSVMRAVSVYTAVTSIIGLVALGYVLTVARRSGYLGPQDDLQAALPPPTMTTTAPAGLSIAPSVPPTAAPRLQQKKVQAKRARSRQARAIAAAATPRRPHMPMASVPPAPVRAASNSPKPSARPIVPSARPAASRPARQAPRESTMPPTVNTMPVEMNRAATIPVRPSRPPGAAPAWLRMGPPTPGVRAQPAVFQVRAASIRAPFWVQPPSPTLVDRFLGRGTRRMQTPPAPPPWVAPPVQPTHQPAGSR